MPPMQLHINLKTSKPSLKAIKPGKAQRSTMRLAIEILASAINEAVVAVLPISDDMQPEDRVIFSWSKEKKKATFGSASMDVVYGPHARLLREVVEIFEEKVETVPHTTPAQFFRTMLAEGAKEVVYDGTKFRNVATMTAGETQWKTVGFDITTETAPEATEEMARRRLQKEVADMMAAEPKNAGKLAKWYTDGMPVEKIVAAGAVDVIDWHTLALDGEKIEPVVKVVRTRKPRAE